MKKTILIVNILAVFVLMMTPCIPAVQVQSNESSINKTLSQKTSLLFYDADNEEKFESTISLVFKKLSSGLIDDGFQDNFNPLRKWLNRIWGLLLLFDCFTILPMGLISWFLCSGVFGPLSIIFYGKEQAELEFREIWRMFTVGYLEVFLTAIQLLTIGIWPEDGEYVQKPPWIRW